MIEVIKYLFSSEDRIVGTCIVVFLAAWAVKGWFQIHHHHDHED